MSALDPRAPVIVGIGELVQRPGQAGSAPPEPAAMMAAALRLAADDAGPGARLLQRAQLLAAVPAAAWMDGNQAGRVGELLGITPRTLRSSMQGGNGPQRMVSELGARIAAGQADIALLCGAEALHTLATAARSGQQLDWPPADHGRVPDEVVEGEAAPATDAEAQAGVIAPVIAYPLIENAIRHERGTAPAQHLLRVAGLWSRFSAVAAGHPCAWTPRFHTELEIATASPSNRQVTLPYTKLLNANIQVDQAAALVLCSAEAARALGVPRDRWTFVAAGAHATDEWFLSEREHLHRSPAIAACGAALFGHAGIGPGDIAHVDLYSCFPAAVQLAARELGLPLEDPARPLTCTGGLTFFGGPGNNYATHGIAALVRRLRDGEPGELGLATALGWYATKHALGLYSATPPRRPFASLEPTVRAARRETAQGFEGEALAETCTVVYERDGSGGTGVLFALTGDGRRALARTGDPEVMAAMAADGFLGSQVQLRGGSFEPAS